MSGVWRFKTENVSKQRGGTNGSGNGKVPGNFCPEIFLTLTTFFSIAFEKNFRNLFDKIFNWTEKILR